MAKIKTKYVCQSCGYETSKWLGKCPECTKWNTFVEEIEEKKSQKEVFVISILDEVHILLLVATDPLQH